MLDQKYLGYLSHSTYFQQTCFHSSIGVHVEKLVFRLGDWFKWQFDLPSIAEQRRIVTVLDTWGHAIANVERLINAKRRRKTGVIGHLLFDTTAKRGFISDLAVVNPRGPAIAPESHVSFVGMDDVSEHGKLARTHERRRGDIGAGYTAFVDGDILVAKITPCFENGKGALAHGLANGVGFGSTEFHVVRPFDPADAAYLHQITLTGSFRTAGERQMTGSAGQRRIPAEFIEDFPIFVLGENARRAAGALLSRLDAELESHEAALTKLRTQKRALMQKLLTGEWRLDERFDPAALRLGLGEEAA
ncbi:hypothetical protein Y590_18255 [Methylobacterium sp. AMS5]|nr:hypothetical protein Y590_18255 [Methylobacterium sp. AMS5]